MACCPEGDTMVSPLVKYVLLIGTFLHWLSGAGMVALGLWAFVETNKYFYQPIVDAYDILFNMSILLIIAGGVMFVITMCGFVGALRENTCLLKFFYICLTVVFLIELVGCVCIFVFKDKAIDVINGVLKDNYITEYHDDYEGIMDHFQENYECCGIEGYKDYNNNAYFNCSDDNRSGLKCAVPYSCCKDPDNLSPGLNNMFCGSGTLAPNATNTDVIWTQGCVDSVISFFADNFPVIGGIVIAIVLPQLIGIILGRMFVNQIEDQWDTLNGQRRQQHMHDMRKADRVRY